MIMKVCNNSSLLPSHPQLNASQSSTPTKSAQKHWRSNPKTTPPQPLFAEGRTLAKSRANAQNRLTHLQLGELEAAKEKEVMQGYRRIRELWASMTGGDEEYEREWMVEAEIVDMFRETRNLFFNQSCGLSFCFWVKRGAHDFGGV